MIYVAVESDYSSESDDESFDTLPEVSPSSICSKKRQSSEFAVLGQKRVLDDLSRHMFGVTVEVSPKNKRPCSSDFRFAVQPQVVFCCESSRRNSRVTMEDFVTVEMNLFGSERHPVFYAGVFDGHNGNSTSEVLHRLLHESIKTRVDLFDPFTENETTREILNQVFLEFDLALLRMERDEYRCNKSNVLRRTGKPVKLRRAVASVGAGRSTSCSGSTATIVLVSRDKAVIAWVGDSRAVLCRNGVAKRLTRDHKGTDALERERIRTCGGMVSSDGRLYHDLSISRAFGSFKHKFHDITTEDTIVDAAIQLRNPLLCVPEIEIVDIQTTDEFIVIASDGVWDTLSDEQVASFIKTQVQIGNKNTAAELLVDFAIAQGSTDNVSAVCAFFY